MRKRLPWVLLIVSAAFNVFLVAGMLVARAHHKRMGTAEGRAAVLAEELGMGDEQRAAYVDLLKQSRERRDEDRERRRAEYQRVWIELARDKPDEAVLEEFVRSPGSSERRKRFLDHARALMEILRPEQRARVAEVMERFHRRRHKWHGGTRRAGDSQ
jgi:uncharacterized membrane protein